MTKTAANLLGGTLNERYAVVMASPLAGASRPSNGQHLCRPSRGMPGDAPAEPRAGTRSHANKVVTFQVLLEHLRCEEIWYLNWRRIIGVPGLPSLILDRAETGGWAANELLTPLRCGSGIATGHAAVPGVIARNRF